MSPRRTSIGSNKDLSRRLEPRSGRASPARSILGSDSASILSRSRPPNSSRATPGKQTSSPSYYDYTEEFNNDASHRGKGPLREALPPPPFPIESTIHENRVLSSGSPGYSNSFGAESEKDSDLQGLSMLPDEKTTPSLEKPHVENCNDNMERSTNVTQDILPLYLDRRSPGRTALVSPQETHPDRANSASKDIIRSGSSDHVLADRTNAQPAVDMEKSPPPASQDIEEYETGDQNDITEIDSLSNRGSTFRMSTLLPSFPDPPNRPVRVNTEVIPAARSQRGLIIHPEEQAAEYESHENALPYASISKASGKQLVSSPDALLTSTELQKGSSRPIPKNLTFTQLDHIRSSRFYSIDHGLTDLAQMITNFEAADRSSPSGLPFSMSKGATVDLSTRPLPPIPPHKVEELGKTTSTEGFDGLPLATEPRLPLNKFRSEGDLKNLNVRRSRTVQTVHPEEEANCYSGTGEWAGNSDLQVTDWQSTSNSFPRSDPPMLAPKPISPLRVLRLKESIPQLMKALPPIPRDEWPMVSTLQQKSSFDFSSQLAPQTKDLGFDNTVPKSSLHDIETISAPRDLGAGTLAQESHPSPAKFKLKSRLFAPQRSLSPLGTRPWNLEESYPWAGKQPSIRLAPLPADDTGLQQVSQSRSNARNASIESCGTTRINPSGKDYRVINSLDLSNPKDLFTSAPGLSGMFHHVGKQLSNRKESAYDSSVTATTSIPMNSGYEQNSSAEIPFASPITSHAMSPTEVRSFFSDNSSRARGHGSLRKRLSNLRARIPGSRPATQSRDTVAGREQERMPGHEMDESRLSRSSTEGIDDYGMPATAILHHRLKSKVSGWFKEARMAIRRHRKLRNRNSDEVRCLPVHR